MPAITNILPELTEIFIQSDKKYYEKMILLEIGFD
jgi:hypothetical protein